MKLHYGGKYKDESDLKVFGEDHEGEVAFREPDQKMFALIANVCSIAVCAALFAILYFIARPDYMAMFGALCYGCILSMLTLLPHELLHALCFKNDVYLYLWPSKMMAFVHGTESMSKSRFIFMSLLPNIVFGVIPFVLFLINREWLAAGSMGAMCISMGLGDYINVFNAATQMPKGAKAFMKGFHTYWYMDSSAKNLKTVFESENIRFVEVSESLVDDYLVMINDVENVQKYIRREYAPREPYTREQEIEWVNEQIREKALVFSMIEKKNSSFVGNISLMDPADSVAELGIAVTAAKQDSGYGSEAIPAVMEYGFDTLGLKKITLKVNPENARAIHVYEKCGFREYDRTYEHIFMEAYN